MLRPTGGLSGSKAALPEVRRNFAAPETVADTGRYTRSLLS